MIQLLVADGKETSRVVLPLPSLLSPASAVQGNLMQMPLQDVAHHKAAVQGEGFQVRMRVLEQGDWSLLKSDLAPNPPVIRQVTSSLLSTASSSSAPDPPACLNRPLALIRAPSLSCLPSVCPVSPPSPFSLSLTLAGQAVSAEHVPEVRSQRRRAA